MSSCLGPPPASATAVRTREDPVLADRIAVSAAAGRGAQLRTEDVHAWLTERRGAGDFHVRRIPFAELDDWRFEDGSGNLVHRSGRFFTVEGLHVVEHDGPFGDGPRREWQQPVIRQPEVGILGILAKEFDGVLHFLMQAKMEPGNHNLLQLSPTVQATRSNYTRAHRGTDVHLIDYFVRPAPGRVIVDVLQSEQGSWFFHKCNRNMIVETDDEVIAPADFRWLTLGQIAALLHEDDLVNMNARSVLSCVPYRDTTPGALHSDAQLLSWFTGERSRHDVRAQRVPLASVRGWKHGVEAIEHEHGRYFRVVAVSVRGSNREVAGWTQPLIEPVGLGVVAFLVRELDGVPHVLVNARAEGGFLDTVELAPTVQCTPGNYAHLPAADRPPFLDVVLGADPARIRFEAVQSEEGGRFLHARSRYLAVDAEATEAPLDPPPGFVWATPAQLRALTRHGHYLNVEARTLLACLNAVAARPREGV
ncbi:NDP-hexose 2,3-dehydratase family protein [Streptomyces sp. MMG1121]|uniref:NDP-hexose 2,3-dehydratase family protein n=1 Tax=Streptomyces sp. MMG1121 TaxID=1415544 RepID=UPI0006ADB926|nr:NDP-hexose 2,3-dehydratase family protein [Streptomyces sp. MMG1121]KOV67546.1 NDP-hexose 2,3-dehydratase [Streptomyces sp. MMG1121]